MSLDTQSRGEGSRAEPYSNQLAEMAVRTTSQFLDMQMATMRTLLQTQARAAAAFGFPDCSVLFDGQADDRMRQVFSKGGEQMVNSTQRVAETMAQIHRHVGQIVETQASLAAQNWQQGFEQLGTQTDESLDQVRATARQQAEQFERTAQSVAEATRSAMLEGGNRIREQIQEGGQRARDSIGQAGDQQRQHTDQQRQAMETPNRPNPQGNEEKQKRERVPT
jgi:hypothetical protein